MNANVGWVAAGIMASGGMICFAGGNIAFADGAPTTPARDFTSDAEKAEAEAETQLRRLLATLDGGAAARVAVVAEPAAEPEPAAGGGGDGEANPAPPTPAAPNNNDDDDTTAPDDEDETPGSDETAKDAQTPPAAAAAAEPTDLATVAAKDVGGPAGGGGVWSWVLRAAAPDWWLYLGAAAASVGMALCGVASAAAFGRFFDLLKAGGAGGGSGGLWWAPARRLLSLFAAEFGLNTLANALLAAATNRLGRRLRLRYFACVLRMDAAFFDRARVGTLVQHLSEDIGAVCTAVRQVFTTGLRGALGVVAGGAAMVRASPRLAGLLFAVLPAAAGAGHLCGVGLRKLSKRVSAAGGRANAVAAEDFANIRTVKAFVGEARERRRYARALEEAAGLKARLALATSAFFGALHFGVSGIQLLVCCYGGALVDAGTISSGGMVSVLSGTMRMQRAFAGLSKTSAQVSKATSTCGGALGVVAAAEAAAPCGYGPGGYGGGDLGGDGGQGFGDVGDEDFGEVVGGRFVPRRAARGHLRFDGVRFAYPTRPGHAVLDGFDLDVAPGQVVALVGASGSGKSTVGHLVERFYACDDAGTGGGGGTGIWLDGLPLDGLEPHWVRRQVGLVDQSPALFDMTVRENIRYGRPSATDAEVEAAARVANAHGFITRDFPEGYATPLGERGLQLSGGQRQRIAIARALLKDPRVLILDEATSALDAESERVVQDALDRLMAGRTTIVIAHRLSTIIGADRICVVDGGRVVESGRHDELMAAQGRYAHLFQKQQQQRREEDEAR